MSKEIEYIVVKCASAWEFEHQVSRKLNQGYELAGSVYVTARHFTQALTRTTVPTNPGSTRRPTVK